MCMGLMFGRMKWMHLSVFLFQVVISVEKFKGYKLPGIDKIVAELSKVRGNTLHSEIRKHHAYHANLNASIMQREAAVHTQQIQRFAAEILVGFFWRTLNRTTSRVQCLLTLQVPSFRLHKV